MDDIEKIRERKKEKLRRNLSDDEEDREHEEELEEQIDEALRVGLTEDARSRLTNLEMAYPDRAEYVKRQLAGLITSGRVETPITDEKVKEILERIDQDEAQDYDVKFR